MSAVITSNTTISSCVVLPSLFHNPCAGALVKAVSPPKRSASSLRILEKSSSPYASPSLSNSGSKIWTRCMPSGGLAPPRSPLLRDPGLLASFYFRLADRRTAGKHRAAGGTELRTFGIEAGAGAAGVWDELATQAHSVARAGVALRLTAL